jgi:hypothetical protein
MELEDQKAHLFLGHHLIDHLMLGLCAQPSNHGNRVAHLGRGHPDTLVAPGGRFPHGSLGHIIHHEQSLAEVHGVRPNEEILSQLQILPTEGESPWSVHRRPLLRTRG